MRVSYIGNTPAFQAGKVGSIPTTRSIKFSNLMVAKKVLTKFAEQFKIINVPKKAVDKAAKTRYNNKRLKNKKMI